MQQWHEAAADVWVEHEPYYEAEYDAYLSWYHPRTRVRVTHMPPEMERRTPSFTDTYPVHRDQGAALSVRTVTFLSSSYGSIRDL